MIIRENYPLQRFNTFGVLHSAQFFAEVQRVDELQDLVLHYSNPHILGGGSNVLLTQDLEGLVIHNGLKGIEVIEENEEYVRVEIKSGENWHQFVQWAVSHGWGGVENLSLIPGTVGAAPIQNIGAYGVEIKDVLVSVQAMELDTSRIITLTTEDCQLSYRHSLFKMPGYKHRFFILSITLRLSKHPVINTRYADVEKKLKESYIQNPGIVEIHQAIIEIRRNKLPDPAVMGNAGSFFKNPVIPLTQFHDIKIKFPHIPSYAVDDEWIKIPAGWLIDQAGWKGRQLGQVACYDKQALVIINKGGAGGKEIWDFAGMIQEDIFEKFGIRLEPEINVW
ncbi:MAG: UDP-N-acetylmuramate dehydrogenase [Saprospiraceae bacterium]|nr:UDP-N-acetylmuramate dehydrogenase [Saprospiraceae bacterium]